MTKSKMMKIINEANQNKGIRWKVDSTKNNGVTVLTNTYDPVVHFTITKMGYGDEDEISEWLNIKDDNTGTSAIRTKGDTRWDDFSDWEDGMKQAIEAAVNMFYYYY